MVAASLCGMTEVLPTGGPLLWRTMRTGRVFNNAKWIIVCKVIQSLLQMVVGMLCARYLGPSNYGLINYASSVLAFAMPIMRLGLNATLVNELIEDPEKEGEIMGTALAMNMLSSLICMAGVFCFVSVANYGDTTTIIVCVLYSISLFFGALEMIQYWFQYKLMSKYSSVVMLIAYIVVSAYKIFLLASAKSIYWFALTNSIDYGIISASLIIIFLLKGQRFSFSFDRAKKLLSTSKHYILASMMVVVFQSTDHIMLTTMVGSAENGFYSAAITCATVTQFVYLAIIDSFRPMILSEKKENNPRFEHNISRLYCLISYLALAQSLVFSIFAELIVTVLYGRDYTATIPVLRILTWYFIFSCMGTVRNIWILAEQKQKYLWRINLSGALANIAMNAFLIPLAGARGAAFASFLTQFFTNFILGFIIKPIRKNNILLLRGLYPGFVVREFKGFLNALRNGKI